MATTPTIKAATTPKVKAATTAKVKAATTATVKAATTPTVKAEEKRTQPPESTTDANEPSDYPPPPPFIDSVSSLRSLSTTLSAFIHRYDDLDSHLRHIHTTIQSNLLVNPVSGEITITASTNSPNNATTTVQSELETTTVQSELETICQTKCGRHLRLYILSHLNEIEKLRLEAPKALKKCPDPTTFVLNCLGRFYLQGIKAYTTNSPMITSREASIFGLECFLLMESDRVVIDPKVREEAEGAALVWRNRLVTEGGVSKACEADARGLLLLISCFGIPNAFTNLDIRSLIGLCNLKQIAPALQRSTVLQSKIPGLLEEMVKSNLTFDAADIAYALQLENLPGKILTEFLNKSEKTWKNSIKLAKSSSIAMNKANRTQLINLKSVISWLEKHKLDPSHHLPNSKIIEKVTSLEKDILKLDKEKEGKTWLKRAIDESKSSKNETKRQKVTDTAQQHKQPKIVIQPKKVNRSTAAPMVTYRPAPVPVSDNITSSSIAGNVSGLFAAYPRPGLSTARVDVLPKVDTAVQTASNYIQFNGQRDDTAALYDRSVMHNNRIYGSSTSGLLERSFARMPSPPIGSAFGLPGRQPFPGLPTQQHQMAGFSGLPSQQRAGLGGNLYRFADILDGELDMGRPR